MVKRLRLPLVIAVVVIVALLLPGPALLAGPEYPRMNGIQSFVSGTPGVKIAYGANGDAKTGLVTFVGRVYNTQASVYWRGNAIRAKVPWNAQLVESWCGTPGNQPADGPDADGWLQWNNKKGGGETSSPVCGFTVAGWDGKSMLQTGWQASWDGMIPDKKPNSLGYIDDTNNRDNVVVASVNYPFDTQEMSKGVFTKGYYRVVGVDGSNNGRGFVYVPTENKFMELENAVKALQAKAGSAATQEEE